MHSPETEFERDLRFTLLGALGVLTTTMAFWSIRERERFRISQQHALALNQEQAASQILPPPPPPLPSAPPSRERFRTRRNTTLMLSSLLLLVAIVLGLLLGIRLFSSTHLLSQSPGTHSTGSRPAPVSTPTTPATLHRTDFERGIIYPRWHQDSYGPDDTLWQSSLSTIKNQTGARWIEIPILFSQATSSSTLVEQWQSTATVEAFIAGVHKAHAQGYHVFFVPLMQVREPGGWSGSIQLATEPQQQTWFDSYWNTIKPYAQAAEANGVEQIAVGTELQWLQQYAPASLWQQLIARMHNVFTRALTYDMNWSSLAQSMPDWLKDPALTYIGVSAYIPLVDTPKTVDPNAMPALWHDKIKVQLDALATHLGKQVLITEIGYRSSADALYRTWEANSNAPADPNQQAGAYNAALANVLPDPQIAGIFFWAWDDAGQHSIKGQPAVQVLHKWYTS